MSRRCERGFCLSITGVCFCYLVVTVDNVTDKLIEHDLGLCGECVDSLCNHRIDRGCLYHIGDTYPATVLRDGRGDGIHFELLRRRGLSLGKPSLVYVGVKLVESAELNSFSASLGKRTLYRELREYEIGTRLTNESVIIVGLELGGNITVGRYLNIIRPGLRAREGEQTQRELFNMLHVFHF